jgi:magnesium transporter
MHATYHIVDKVVDAYFPIVYKIEDFLNEVEDKLAFNMRHFSIDQVFDLRSDLLRLRRTIIPMRDLLYRIMNSDRINLQETERAYFGDIYDHLLKLAEIIESNRELTADIRDSHMSINSSRMNRIMMILTIVSTVFIPLTFIAGVYGMNFVNMPEIEWKYGYFIVLALMAMIAISMLAWFKYKGWFSLFKN